METLSNGIISISVNSFGAELSSLRRGDTEYLWDADPAFWKRHSPVLFPIVGSVCDGVFRVDGKEYPMGQHGFARDMEFRLVSKSSDEIFYELCSTPETLAKYPFEFRLTIGYRLKGASVEVIWKVENPLDKAMPFQIGAHPAFFYPQYNPETSNRGSFTLNDGTGKMEYILIGGAACADVDHRYESEAVIPLTPDSFNHDAFIFDRSQVKKVTLNAPDGTPWLALSFDAPLVGLWSPNGKNAPFVCVEPWYGRCDRMGFKGEFADRDEVQILPAGAEFEASYTIEIL